MGLDAKTLADNKEILRNMSDDTLIRTALESMGTVTLSGKKIAYCECADGELVYRTELSRTELEKVVLARTWGP